METMTQKTHQSLLLMVGFFIRKTGMRNVGRVCTVEFTRNNQQKELLFNMNVSN